MDLVSVPAATFWMGTNHASSNQAPAHVVRVGAFSMMRCPVSRADYAAFLADARHPAPPFWDEPRYSDPHQPAVGPSWDDAVAYAEWLSARLGQRVRLPTEAEREWAACGGALDTVYPWGNAPREPPCGPLGDGPALLGSWEPNGFGLHHMADGVHEWCADFYDADWYARSPQENPQGPPGGVRRVARGGSWRHRIRVTPSRARSSLPPDHRYADFGFRLVISSR